jgi:YVTN family beta-propeller protein
MQSSFDKVLARHIVLVHNPSALSVNPNTYMMYVANSGDDTVSVINDIRVPKSLPVGNGPSDISVDPNANLIYVDDSLSDTVSIIDGTTNKQISTKLR